jgi:hypothetical protein
VSSFEILKNNNCSIILLESVNCKTRDELVARERYYFETIECVNKNLPVRTDVEYREYKLQYYHDNKETLNPKCECECGSKYTIFNKSRHFKTKKHLDYLAINI